MGENMSGTLQPGALHLDLKPHGAIHRDYIGDQSLQVLQQLSCEPRKTGNMVHSRGLTFAEAILLLWMSKHGLRGELLQHLRDYGHLYGLCVWPHAV